MRVRPLIVLLPFLWWGFDAMAQVPQESSSMPPEQWELTLDVIKSKAQSLVVENNGLQGEYQQLIGGLQKLQRAVYDQEYKNAQMDRFLKERHGRTYQQERIDELNQMIKTKTRQAKADEDQLEDLQKRKSKLDKNIQRLKYTISGLEFHQNGPPPQAEVHPMQNLNDDAVLSQATARFYDHLKKHKEELEAKISAYESRMDELRQSTMRALSWPLEKKTLVHEMVKMDARNNKMRDSIKFLQEDIGVLRDQVAKLERKIDFAGGKTAHLDL